jgi:predicted transport protein
VSVILSKIVYMYMYPIPNSFRDRVISLYSSEIVDKKEILRTVSNTGIYCSSDKDGTVYLV